MDQIVKRQYKKKYTQILADYLSDLKYEDIPAEVIERAKLMTIHTVGAAISSVRSKAATDMIDLAKCMGGSGVEATVFGDGTKVALTSAAMANGCLADLLDWEDCSWTGHPSAGAVPAGIAVAEAFHKSGKDYLTALVGGYDVYQRIAMAIQPGPVRFFRGWGLHCWQIFAPASVTGKLLGVKGKQMNQLLGAAGTMTPATTLCMQGSDSDFYHHTHGLTCQMAIECALIAKNGISKLEDILEFDGGFYECMSDQCVEEWYDKDLGEKYMIMEVMQKPWPVNMWNQSPVDLIHIIKKKYNPDPNKIKRIDITPFILLRSEDAPENGYDSIVSAQFSIPFCVAMYLKGPLPGYDWLDPKWMTDPEILDLAKKVKSDGERCLMPENFKKFQAGGYIPYTMKVTMEDGTEYYEELPYPTGHPKNPYTRETIVENFNIQTAAVMSPEKQKAFCDFVLNLENVEDMATISPLLKC